MSNKMDTDDKAQIEWKGVVDNGNKMTKSIT